MERLSIGGKRASAEKGPIEMSTKKNGHDQDDPGKTPGGIRIPPILMIPVGLAVGWLVAGWMGAGFGGVIGLFLWRSRG